MNFKNSKRTALVEDLKKLEAQQDYFEVVSRLSDYIKLTHDTEMLDNLNKIVNPKLFGGKSIKWEKLTANEIEELTEKIKKIY